MSLGAGVSGLQIKSYRERLAALDEVSPKNFMQRAHRPFFEEPKKMREIVRADVLTGSKGLADSE